MILVCFYVEVAFVLRYAWMHQVFRLTVSAATVWAAAKQGVDLLALVLLNRWLATRSPSALFRAAAWSLAISPALWLLAPSLAGRVFAGVTLAFAHALIWPRRAKAHSRTGGADLTGIGQALTALFSIVPFALLESVFMRAIGVGPVMAVTAAAGAATMWMALRTETSGKA